MAATMTHRRLVWLLAVCLWLSGCAALLVGGGGNPPSAEERTAAGVVSDDSLAVTVESRLTADRSVEASGIDVSIRGGRVTLAGEVGSFAERDRAGRLAAGVRGVVGVDNRLIVRTGN